MALATLVAGAYYGIRKQNTSAKKDDLEIKEREKALSEGERDEFNELIESFKRAITDYEYLLNLSEQKIGLLKAEISELKDQLEQFKRGEE